MSLIPKEVIDRLEDTSTAINSMNNKLDDVITLLTSVRDELRHQNERCS